VINELLARLLGTAGDYSYGPFLMPRALAAEISAVPPDLGWGWRPHLFRTAHRLEFPVRFVIDAHTCPIEQRVEHHEERMHRIRQLAQNISGLLS
jgi:hypothetical protein